MNIATGSPKVGTIGCTFTIDWGEDLSTATVYTLHFQRPDGSTFSVVPTIYNSNYLRWTTTLSTNLNIEGQWRVTAYIESPTYTGYGEVLYFNVRGMFA